MIRQTVRSFLTLSALSIILGSGGCGPKPELLPGEMVSGKLSIRGKAPGVAGNLEFVSATDKNQKASGSFDQDGTFRGRVSSAGNWKVALKSRMQAPPPGAPPAALPPLVGPGGAEISPNAQNASTSGVEIDVPAGGAKDLVLDFTK